MNSALFVAVSVAFMAETCPNVDSPYGINFHAPTGSSMITAIDEAQALGLGWIRVDFDWLNIEVSRRQFSWARHDAIVAAAQARGLLIFATLAYSPKWATDGEERIGVPYEADWENFVHQAVRRYDGRQGKGLISHWGLWNEPNLGSFWSGTRQQYIDLILRKGAAAVRAANPHAKVLGPELAHVGSSSWWTWLSDCIAQAGDQLDIVTHHVYGSGYATSTQRLERRVWPWDPPSVKEVLQQAGWLGKPVWLTEIGWQSDGNEAQQAGNYSGFLNDWFTADPARGWIHKVFFYELRDTQSFPDLSWGILGQDPAHARKQAFYTYADFIVTHPPLPAIPGSAVWPEPADGTVGVPRRTSLRWDWQAEACSPSYRIYLGQTSPGEFVSEQTTATFEPARLNPLTAYYWRVDTMNPAGLTIGDVWSFTTGPISGDFDADGDVDLEDFGVFQLCYSDLSGPPDEACVQADLNADGAVSQTDFGIFRACLSGANILADYNCDAPG